MNLLTNPNLWASSAGGTPPPADWTGSSYSRNAPAGNETSLLLYLLPPYGATGDRVMGTALMANGANANAVLELRNSGGGTLQTMNVPKGGVGASFSWPVPVGVQVSLAFINSGYDGDYTIIPTADLPQLVAVDDSATTPYQVPVLVEVLNNDTLDGVAPVDFADVTLAVSVAPANGTAEAQPDGTILYTPDPGFHGTDTFQYEITLIEDGGE